MSRERILNERTGRYVFADGVVGRKIKKARMSTPRDRREEQIKYGKEPVFSTVERNERRGNTCCRVNDPQMKVFIQQKNLVPIYESKKGDVYCISWVAARLPEDGMVMVRVQEFHTKAELREIEDEVILQTKIKSEHVPKLIGSFSECQYFCTVTEFIGFQPRRYENFHVEPSDYAVSEMEKNYGQLKQVLMDLSRDGIGYNNENLDKLFYNPGRRKFYLTDFSNITKYENSKDAELHNYFILLRWSFLLLYQRILKGWKNLNLTPLLESILFYIKTNDQLVGYFPHKRNIFIEFFENIKSSLKYYFWWGDEEEVKRIEKWFLDQIVRHYATADYRNLCKIDPEAGEHLRSIQSLARTLYVDMEYIYVRDRDRYS
jgi:hypothetical protein